MSFLAKLKFYLWDDASTVASLIKTWKPKRLKTEKDYEKSLYDYLESKLSSFKITKQFARGRVRVDLAIQDRVIIELKHNFNTTAKYQRLIGQLSEYESWDERIIILLTGKTDPNLRKELERYIQKQFGISDMMAFSSRVILMQK